MNMTVTSRIGQRMKDKETLIGPVHGARGQVRHQRGVTELPGLYFLGLPWQRTRGSALLG
jgi:putative flavoprotein involved in K+ transport